MSLGVVVVGALLVAGFGVLVVLRPQVSLLTLVVLDVSNVNGVVAEQIGTSPYRPQLALAVLVLAVMFFRRQLRWRWSPVHLGLMVLVAGFCFSFVHAADPGTSTALLGERVRDVFYCLVVFTLTLSTGSVRSVVRGSVLVLAALAGLTAVHEFVLGNAGDLFGLSQVPLVREGGASTARHAGTSSDVNFWARLLILFTPLSMSLLAAARTGWSRFVWAGWTVALFLGVYLTQSRGGFIALFIAVVCWLALAGGRFRRSIAAIPLLLLVLVPLSGIGSRLMTLVSATGESGGEDLSVLTRKRLQLDAWHMFLDQPLFGHGIGSYGALFTQYDRTANTYLPVDIVVAAHNFYLEQASDGGVVLLLAWLVFAGTVVFAALRARRLTLVSRDHATLRLLAVGVLGGVVGWAIASVFLHLSDFRALLLMAAIAAVLDLDARRLAVPVQPVAVVRRRPALVPAVAVAVVVGAVGVSVGLLTAPTVYTSSTTLAVEASSDAVDGGSAYQVDVLSRGTIVPTFAQLLDRSVTASDVVTDGADADRVGVSIAESPLGGSVVVTTQAPSQVLATRAGERAVALSKKTVADLAAGYQLTGTPQDASRSTQPGLSLAVAAVPAVLAGLVVWWWRRRTTRAGGVEVERVLVDA